MANTNVENNAINEVAEQVVDLTQEVTKTTKGKVEAIVFTGIGCIGTMAVYHFGGKALKKGKAKIDKLIHKEKNEPVTEECVDTYDDVPEMVEEEPKKKTTKK